MNNNNNNTKIHDKYVRHLHFGGSVGLFYYQVGVASVIEEHFKDHLNSTFITGSSGGSIAGSLLNLSPNIDYEDYIENTCNNIMKDVNNTYFKVITNWNIISRKHVEKMLNEYINKYNVSPLEKLNNKMGIFLTRQVKKNYLQYQTEFITKWDNIQDYINCFMGGGFIPIFDYCKMTDYYKGLRCLDGSLLDNNPILNKIKIENNISQLIIHTNTWRNFKLSDYWISTDINICRNKYIMGKEDALSHIEELKHFFNHHHHQQDPVNQ